MIEKIKKIILGFFDKVFFEHERAEYWWLLRNKAKVGGVKGFFASLYYRHLINRYNSFLPLNTDFSDCPTFPHGIRGIFISGGAKIGKKCVIFQQVTIGSNNLLDSKKRGAPIIGDNVYIGAGAKIIGNICIGDNVRIGANCVVFEDIPDNSTVVLEKPRVLKKEIYQNNRFIEFLQQ